MVVTTNTWIGGSGGDDILTGSDWSEGALPGGTAVLGVGKADVNSGDVLPTTLTLDVGALQSGGVNETPISDLVVISSTLGSGWTIDNEQSGGILQGSTSTAVIGSGLIARGTVTSAATINIGAGDIEYIVSTGLSATAGDFINLGQINLVGVAGNSAVLYVGPPPTNISQLTAAYGNISVTDGFVTAAAADQAASGGGASGDITLHSNSALLVTASLANTDVTYGGAGDIMALGQTAGGASTYQQVGGAVSGFGAGDTIALDSDGTAAAAPTSASYSGGVLTIANASGTLASLDIGAGYSNDVFSVQKQPAGEYVVNSGNTSFTAQFNVTFADAWTGGASGADFMTGSNWSEGAPRAGPPCSGRDRRPSIPATCFLPVSRSTSARPRRT